MQPIASDRRHRFEVAPDVVWAAISEVGDYRSWWPWLRRLDAEGLVAGDVWRCTVQPPLPYTLRFAITLGDVVEGESVEAQVSGDIVGEARLELAPLDGGGCETRLVSRLLPANPVLQAFATVARPMVRFGHDWVLDTGAKQFERAGLRGSP